MMVMDFMGWWHRCFSRTVLETFMPESWSYCTKQFFIPVWWSVYTEGFLPGAKLDAHGLTIDCCRLPMIASSNIDQRLPASGTWLAPVIKVVAALNPAFSSASGLLKRGSKAMPGVCRPFRYVKSLRGNSGKTNSAVPLVSQT